MPKIDDAKQLAQKCHAEGVIIIAFAPDDFAAVSYGRNRELCRKYGRVLDQIGDLIADGEIEIQ